MTENTITPAISAKTPEQMMAERFRGYYPVVIDVETAGFNADTDALRSEEHTSELQSRQ